MFWCFTNGPDGAFIAENLSPITWQLTESNCKKTSNMYLAGAIGTSMYYKGKIDNLGSELIDNIMV